MNGANSATNSAAGEIRTAVRPDGTSCSPKVIRLNGSRDRHDAEQRRPAGPPAHVGERAADGAAQRDQQHERGERGARPHDHRRAEVLERVLDQQVGAAPDRRERGEQSDLAGRHATSVAAERPQAEMTIPPSWR